MSTVTFTDATGRQVTIEGEIRPIDLATMDRSKPFKINGQPATYIQLGEQHIIVTCHEPEVSPGWVLDRGGTDGRGPPLLDALRAWEEPTTTIKLHSPPPTSARWDGPPPRSARRRSG